MNTLRRLADKLEQQPKDTREYAELEDQLELAILQLEWKQGKRRNTVKEIIEVKKPGLDFKYRKSLPKRANDREKRALERRDLALHYRCDHQSLALRGKIIKACSESCFKFHQVYGRYGYEALLRSITDKGRIITITYDIVLQIEALITRLLKGYEYNLAAQNMRSPYQGISAGPISLIGIYKPIALNSKGQKWLEEETGFANVKNFINSKLLDSDYTDTNISSGIMTPYVLETLLRQSIRKNKVEYTIKDKANARKLKKRLPVRYAWTPTMKKVFVSTEPYLLNTQVKKFVYSMIDRNSVIDISSPYDPLLASHRAFLDEMSLINDFLDNESEKKEQIAKERKLKDKPLWVRKIKKKEEYEDID